MKTGWISPDVSLNNKRSDYNRTSDKLTKQSCINAITVGGFQLTTPLLQNAIWFNIKVYAQFNKLTKNVAKATKRKLRNSQK